MGHIKGSLGHGGWYLTQIHIFHSDGRGTVEGGREGGRVRIGCARIYTSTMCVCACTWGWSACLASTPRSGWVARRGASGVDPGGGGGAQSVRVGVCARARAWNGWVFGWIGQGWCVPAAKGRGTLVRRRAGRRRHPATFRPLSPPTPVRRGARMFGRGSVATSAVGCTVRARTPTK